MSDRDAILTPEDWAFIRAADQIAHRTSVTLAERIAAELRRWSVTLP